MLVKFLSIAVAPRPCTRWALIVLWTSLLLCGCTHSTRNMPQVKAPPELQLMLNELPAKVPVVFKFSPKALAQLPNFVSSIGNKFLGIPTQLHEPDGLWKALSDKVFHAAWVALEQQLPKHFEHYFGDGYRWQSKLQSVPPLFSAAPLAIDTERASFVSLNDLDLYGAIDYFRVGLPPGPNAVPAIHLRMLLPSTTPKILAQQLNGAFEAWPLKDTKAVALQAEVRKTFVVLDVVISENPDPFENLVDMADAKAILSGLKGRYKTGFLDRVTVAKQALWGSGGSVALYSNLEAMSVFQIGRGYAELNDALAGAPAHKKDTMRMGMLSWLLSMPPTLDLQAQEYEDFTLAFSSSGGEPGAMSIALSTTHTTRGQEIWSTSSRPKKVPTISAPVGSTHGYWSRSWDLEAARIPNWMAVSPADFFKMFAGWSFEDKVLPLLSSPIGVVKGFFALGGIEAAPVELPDLMHYKQWPGDSNRGAAVFGFRDPDDAKGLDLWLKQIKALVVATDMVFSRGWTWLRVSAGVDHQTAFPESKRREKIPEAALSLDGRFPISEKLMFLRAGHALGAHGSRWWLKISETPHEPAINIIAASAPNLSMAVPMLDISDGPQSACMHKLRERGLAIFDENNELNSAGWSNIHEAVTAWKAESRCLSEEKITLPPLRALVPPFLIPKVNLPKIKKRLNMFSRRRFAPGMAVGITEGGTTLDGEEFGLNTALLQKKTDDYLSLEPAKEVPDALRLETVEVELPFYCGVLGGSPKRSLQKGILGIFGQNEGDTKEQPIRRKPIAKVLSAGKRSFVIDSPADMNAETLHQRLSAIIQPRKFGRSNRVYWAVSSEATPTQEQQGSVLWLAQYVLPELPRQNEILVFQLGPFPEAKGADDEYRASLREVGPNLRVLIDGEKITLFYEPRGANGDKQTKTTLDEMSTYIIALKKNFPDWNYAIVGTTDSTSYQQLIRALEAVMIDDTLDRPMALFSDVMWVPGELLAQSSTAALYRRVGGFGDCAQYHEAPVLKQKK